MSEAVLNNVLGGRLIEDTSIIATLSCQLEASARKVGNVHPHRHFLKTTYHDFITSAIVISPAFREVEYSIGERVLHAVQDTFLAVGQNTNLGMLLLIAPLASVEAGYRLVRSYDLPEPCFEHQQKITEILTRTTVADAKLVFQAIRKANPGGLGTADKQDVSTAPTVTLLEAMKLAADRDLIARQYANNYADVFDLGVPALLEGFAKFGCVEAAVIHCQLKWMSVFPDSLIVRKLGMDAGETVRKWAEDVLLVGGLETAEGRAAGVALDTYLRSDGNKLNPGTTADLVCACLFVALREGKLKLNAPFPWTVEDWL